MKFSLFALAAVVATANAGRPQVSVSLPQILIVFCRVFSFLRQHSQVLVSRIRALGALDNIRFLFVTESSTDLMVWIPPSTGKVAPLLVTSLSTTESRQRPAPPPTSLLSLGMSGGRLARKLPVGVCPPVLSGP